MLKTFRKKVITGLLILTPSALTLYIFYVVIKIIAGIITPVVPLILKIPFFSRWPQTAIYALSALIAVLALWFLGEAASNIIGAAFLRFFDRLFLKAPVLNKIYITIKQIIVTVAKKKTAFKKVARIDYPRKGIKTIVFITGETKIRNVRYYYLFVPTTPNPTSGFFVMAPVEEVEELDLDTETAMKMIISGGMLDSGHRL